MLNTPLFLGVAESGSTGLTPFNFNCSFAVFFCVKPTYSRALKRLFLMLKNYFVLILTYKWQFYLLMEYGMMYWHM